MAQPVYAYMAQPVHAGGLLDLQSVDEMLDSDQIGALGLDVQWQEPWDPHHRITAHPKSVCLLFAAQTLPEKPMCRTQSKV